jgi:hypothetical protein
MERSTYGSRAIRFAAGIAIVLFGVLFLAVGPAVAAPAGPPDFTAPTEKTVPTYTFPGDPTIIAPPTTTTPTVTVPTDPTIVSPTTKPCPHAWDKHCQPPVNPCRINPKACEPQPCKAVRGCQTSTTTPTTPTTPVTTTTIPVPNRVETGAGGSASGVLPWVAVLAGIAIGGVWLARRVTVYMARKDMG